MDDKLGSISFHQASIQYLPQLAVAFSRAGKHAGMSESVREMFATIAQRYDLANRVLSAGRDVSWRRSALKLLDDQDDRRLLDLACGTFDLGLDALSGGHAGRVIGGDFCPPMLHAGADKITEAAVSPVPQMPYDCHLLTIALMPQ